MTGSGDGKRGRPGVDTPGRSLTRDDGRLTLQLPAVTLSLPDGFDDLPAEDDRAAAPPAPAPEPFPLELDTGELHPPEGAAPPAPRVTPPEARPLDLDLTSFEAPDLPRISLPPGERASREPPLAESGGPFAPELHTSDFAVVEEKEAVAMVHDAWTRDRMERRSPTPSVPAPAMTPHRPTRQLRAPRKTPPPATLGDADALHLVDAAPKGADTGGSRDLAGEMAERYALGDFSGALVAAELLLGRDPAHAQARAYGDAARERLVALYTSRLGGLHQVPVVAVRPSDVRWLGLDHQAAFLLSRIDGVATLADLLQVGGAPLLDALKIVVELFEAGAIRWR